MDHQSEIQNLKDENARLKRELEAALGSLRNSGEVVKLLYEDIAKMKESIAHLELVTKAKKEK